MAHFFPFSSNFAIHGSQFTDASVTVNNNVMSKLQFLHQFTALGASYDSKDQDESPKCHEDTRVQLLKDIHEWSAVADKENGIMFLHGPAGAGKSCIARSACHDAASKGLLGASFFFRRGTSDRGNANKFILTLAYQLARSDERLADIIHRELAQNPHVVDMALEEQFQRMIFTPCIALTRERLQIRAIVIDGLDECADIDAQLKILNIMTTAVRCKQFPLGIFVTSRPELHIQEALLLNQKLIPGIQAISLTNVPDTRQDILTVIQSGFTRILNEPRFKYALRSVPRPWPSYGDVETLVSRSSDQFIYAATVLKFISSPVHNPASRLDIVLGLGEGSKSSPFEDLDRLYHAILSTVLDSERTIDVLRYILAIKDIAVNRWRVKLDWDITDRIWFNQKRLLLVVEQLLNLPQDEAYLALSQIHSLISIRVGLDSYTEYSPILFHHKSFKDFLFDKSRSNGFFINLEATHADIATSCLMFLSRPHYETDEEHVCWVYSAFRWNYHIASSNMKINLRNFSFSLQRLFLGPTYNLNQNCLSDQFWERYIFRYPESTFHLYNCVNFKCLQWNDKVSLEDTYRWVLDIWRTMGKKRSNFDYQYFMETFMFPVFLQYFQLKSYGDECLMKHLLMIIVLICLPISSTQKNLIFMRRYLEDVYLDFTEPDMFRNDLLDYCCETVPVFLGNIRDTEERLFALRRTKNQPVNWEVLVLFISDQQNSGPFYCTAMDWEQMFVRAIQYMADDNITLWMSTIHSLKPMPSLKLLETLKLAALHCYYDIHAGRELRHSAEISLVSWLEELDQPPQELIVAWKGVFQKAKHLTLSNVDGYEYFCDPVRACSYCSFYPPPKNRLPRRFNPRYRSNRA